MVVVGTGLQNLDPLGYGGPGHPQKDGNAAAAFPQGPENAQAVSFRQYDVNHRHIQGSAHEAAQANFPICFSFYGMAGSSQRFLDQAAD